MTPEERAVIRNRDFTEIHPAAWQRFALRDRRALLDELDRLHSWDGLMELLNEHWPEDIFVTAPNPEDYHEPLYRRSPSTGGETYSYVQANPGAIITGLIRWVDRERHIIAEHEETIRGALGTAGPHSPDCARWWLHPHGPQCSPDCPTCGGSL